MWYFNGQTIKTPKEMVIDDITYPKAIFRNSDTLTSLGIKPYSEIKPDGKYYHSGAYTLDASGDEVVGTYAAVARDVDMLKANMLEQINLEVSSRQSNIDWYWARADKGHTAVPANIATYATTIYSEQATKESEVAALSTLDAIKLYGATPHTEVRKDQNADGTYHASDTHTVARLIDMLTHWTEHPDDKVDAGFVSLTAD